MIARTTALIATGAALAGAAVVGIPVLVVAATNDDRWPGPGRFFDGDGGHGFAMMQGRGGGRLGGGMGGGMGGGHGMGHGALGDLGGGPMMGGGPFGWRDGEPAGELTDAQADALALNAEREKQARDLYTAFADSTGEVRFARLAHAASAHLRALQEMLDVYEVTDPTAANGPGEYADAGVAEDYARLLEEGSASEDAAVEVTRALEESAADRLDDAADDVEDDASDVSRLYEHLALAADRHADLLDE